MNPIWLNAVRASGGAVPWYLAGGAPMPVAAYQPIGAASLAASYVNLANPGTFDAAPGVAPLFSTLTGWQGDGTRWLNTGIVPANASYTYIVRCFEIASGVYDLFGINDGTNNARANIRPNIASNHQFRHGGADTLNVAHTDLLVSGVFAIAGKAAYINGVSVGTIAGGGFGAATALEAYLMASNQTFANAIMVGYWMAGAVYSSTLTAPQVAAVSAAMADLT